MCTALRIALPGAEHLTARPPGSGAIITRIQGLSLPCPTPASHPGNGGRFHGSPLPHSPARCASGQSECGPAPNSLTSAGTSLRRSAPSEPEYRVSPLAGSSTMASTHARSSRCFTTRGRPKWTWAGDGVQRHLDAHFTGHRDHPAQYGSSCRSACRSRAWHALCPLVVPVYRRHGGAQNLHHGRHADVVEHFAVGVHCPHLRHARLFQPGIRQPGLRGRQHLVPARRRGTHAFTGGFH
jgi:hypothetical protein